MNFVYILISICVIYLIFRKKKYQSGPGHQGLMFDFSKMPNSGFNKKKTQSSTSTAVEQKKNNNQ